CITGLPVARLAPHVVVVDPSQHFRTHSFWNDDALTPEEHAILCTYLISDGPVVPDGYRGLLFVFWPSRQHD
ncbi:hypothetical protein NQZ68_041947, partial [Dissostichus eleginoides]